MPFTLSHAAAAFPLRRALGRRAVWSALVIGSFMPDLPYFLPLGIPRHVTHSELGLLYYGIPGGLVMYVWFHLVMKQPLALLLPEAVRARLQCGALESGLPPARWFAVILSLGAGAASHLLWDAFTHGDAFGVAWVPALAKPVGELGDYVLHGHSLLQHASTVFGLGVLAVAVKHWLRRTPPTNDLHAMQLSPRLRTATLVALMFAPMLTAALTALDALDGPLVVTKLQAVAGRSLIAGLRAFGLAVCTYCVLWQVSQRYVGARRDTSAILDR